MEVSKNEWSCVSFSGRSKRIRAYLQSLRPCRLGPTPIKVDLDGLGDQHSFLVDWKALNEDQQSLILQYMGAKFGASQSEICGRIEADGHFPIRSEWVIESYSLRMFM